MKTFILTIFPAPTGLKLGVFEGRGLCHVHQLRMCLMVMLMSLVSACGSGNGQTLGHPDVGLSNEAIPMSVDKNHASVKVLINGQTFNFLLDSGADQNVMSARAAAQLGLPLSVQTVSGKGAAGSYDQVHWVDIPEMRIGSAKLPHQAAFIIPLPEEVTFDGLLGFPFFQAFVVQMDYQQAQLRLSLKQDFSAPVDATTLPLNILANKLLVNANVAGVPGWYVVDTGASGSVTLFTPTVEKYALRSTLSPLLHVVTGISAGGITEGDLVRLPELRLGTLQMRQVVAELSSATDGAFAHPLDNTVGNLGSELWHRFTVTIDVAGGMLYLKPNNAYTQSFDGPRAGLVAPLDQGKMKVIQVVPGSPAAQAGVQVGDTAVAIEADGKLLQVPEQMSAALRGPAGALLTLHLRGTDGVERVVSIVLRDLI